jgi:hypothetical protein
MQPNIVRAVPGPFVVGIPVRDEAERIGRCLAALVEQHGAALDAIVLLVNNTTDDTVQVARDVPMPRGTALHIIERALPPPLANAGQARRLAMREAWRIAGGAGVLLTTDADGQVDRDWLASNIADLNAGADAVAGWCDLDPADWSNIPLSLHEDNARECAYDALCDELHARLDPDPFDPMPRHTQNSGASIAVVAEAYHRCGGVPAVASGEDRAFLAALRRVDAGIRHSLACHVTVSGRVVGRAEGGMADTIRRRLVAPDPYLDSRLEPAAACALRATLRRRFRAYYEVATELLDLPEMSGLDPAALSALRRRRFFGVAWDELEAATPKLARQLVSVGELAEQMAVAERLVAAAREASVERASAAAL